MREFTVEEIIDYADKLLIGLSDEEAMKTIRITINNDITYEDIDKFIDELEKTIKIISI